MAIYQFKAQTKTGKIKEGTLVAGTREEAGAQLRNEGLAPLFVNPIRPSSRFNLSFSRRVSLVDKANLCRYLAAMVKAGLPMGEALEVLSREADSESLKKVLNEARASLQKGQLLSTAFARFPDAFDEVFLTMIKAGEESGTLDKAFSYLGKQLTADHELRQKIKSTLAYPAAVTAATLSLGLAMLFFVVPRIAPVLLRLSATFPLPSYTMLILKAGVFLSDNLLLILLVMIVAGVGVGLFFTSRRGRRALTVFLSRLPVVGKFSDQIVLARFSRTLSTLLKSGLPIIPALEVSSGTLTLPKYAKLTHSFADKIGKGRPLSDVLRESGLFPSMMVSLITTGEKSATLDELLMELAGFYEQEIGNSLKSLTDLIEPVLMLAIGLAVGFAVVALIAPIYSFVGSLSGSIGG